MQSKSQTEQKYMELLKLKGINSGMKKIFSFYVYSLFVVACLHSRYKRLYISAMEV